MKAPGVDTNGLLLLRKPPGLTSFESLGNIKKALCTGKVGHTGTLDKFASGLLLALVGRSGKLAPWFSFCDKEYRGQIHFGVETDTLDPEGEVTGEANPPSREAVEAVLPGFRGNILQTPPAYSAIHIDGKRAHELSRQGLVPEMKKRPIIIHELELVSWEPPLAEIRVRCSSGTYIRSLARDIAKAAGSRAHLSGLERTRIGGFLLFRAFDPEPGDSVNFSHTVRQALKPIDPTVFDALGLPWVYAEEEQIPALIHGRPLSELLRGGLIKDGLSAPAVGVFGKTGEKEELIAVLERKNGQWSYGHVFAGH